jgi:hypothetical protein
MTSNRTQENIMEANMETEKKTIDSLMTEERTFPPSAAIKANAYITSEEQYHQMWERSINDPDGFWLEQAKSLTWFREPTKSLEYTWDTKRRTAQGSLQIRQCPEIKGYKERRPCGDLYADGSRTCHSNARLRPYRSDSLGHLRRIQFRRYRRSY